jgi:hypothetical protein
MNKLLLFGMASAALITVSCSNNETVEIPSSAAIGFSNVFVDGNTKTDPSFTNDNLPQDFKVNGYVSNGTASSQIFTDELVVKIEDGDWEYLTAYRYWIDGGSYVFGAYAPADIDGEVTTEATATADKLTTTITGFVSDGKTDLLYDCPDPAETANVASTRTARVPLNFNHMLSKVVFSFKNTFDSNSQVQLAVKNVKIKDAYKTAKVVMTGTSPKHNDKVEENSENTKIKWSGFDGEQELNFGNANNAAKFKSGDDASVTDNALLLIPTGTDKAYSVTFDIEVYDGAASILIHTYTDVPANITGIDFIPGYSYNFIAELNQDNINKGDKLNPIKFTVESVANWVEPNNGTLNVPAKTTTSNNTNETTNTEG